jgi:hypothetical protein
VGKRRDQSLVANAFGLLVGAFLFAGAVALSPLGPAAVKDRVRAPLGGGGSSTYLGLPGIGAAGLFERRDGTWDGHVAPAAACPGRDDAGAPVRAQEQVMVCLLNYARQKAGLAPLPPAPLLARAAQLKARDIAECDDFRHEACDRQAYAVVTEAGYPRSGWGENLYTGSGPHATPRAAVVGWLYSDGHRENLLSARWSEQGVALLGGTRMGHPAVIWVSHFSDRR